MFQQLGPVSQWAAFVVRLGSGVLARLQRTRRCKRGTPGLKGISRVRWTIELRVAIVLFCAAASLQAREFDFAALRSVIETRQVNSVEDLIPLLPASLRSRYALVFASRSLQGATYIAPRVILYAADGHLVLTFNGDPDQRGFYSVEILEFGQDEQFRLHEIRFPLPGSKEAVSFSEPNPATCQICHGSPASPVWDSWPLWPGAYGQRYDAPLSAQERSGLQSFIARQTSHPRYRHLLGIQRWADPTTFRAVSSKRYAGMQQEPPNAELAALLGGLSTESLVRQMREKPDFAIYQYALLGLAGADCGAVDDFLPSAARRTALAGLRRLVNESTIANRWAAGLKEQRLGTVSQLPAHSLDAIPPAATLAPLRLIVEGGLGMNTQSWTLALEKGTYDFTPSPGTRPTLRDALLAEMAAQDPTLLELSAYATSADGDRYCRYLQHRSQVALGSSSVAASVDWSLSDVTRAAHTRDDFSAALQPQRLLRICAACHESGVAPYIPFLQESALKQALLSQAGPRARLLDGVLFRLSPAAADGRMPPGIRLSDEERGELERYFIVLGTQAR